MRDRGVRRILPALVAVTCALIVWVGVAAHHARADEPPFFAIKNARIVPVSGQPISNGTIVISHGVIQAVGANVNVPPEARVIDGTGMTVYPGLIDAGTDVGLGAVAAPAGGAGGRGGGGGGGGRGAAGANVPLSMGPEDRPATTPWENAADMLHSDDARIESWRNAGFTTGLVIPRNGYFPGQAAVVDFGTADREEQLVVKTPAALPINLTGGRGEYQGFPSALMGQLSYVRQVFIDAQWYADAMQAYEAHPQGRERPAYDHTDVVISHVLANKELVIWPAETDTQILRAIRMAPMLGARWALSGAQQGYMVPNEIAAANVPVFINTNWPAPGAGGGGGRGGGGGGGRGGGEEGDTLRTLRFRDRAPSTPGLLNKAGVKIAFMSGGVTNPKDTLRNVAKSIAAGLPADVALRALTIGAAEILGVSDRLGSIEPGKIANLVVTDGDIFADRTAVKYVFVDGKFYIPPPVVEAPAGGGGRGGRGGGAGGADISGTWTLSYTTQQGADSATVNLQMAQDGGLSGTVSSQMGTAALTRGRLTGNNFQFSITMQIQGADTQVDFSGTVNGNQMSGTISVSGYDIAFTGRKPNAAVEEVRQ
ncbi:MAG TPA: amidohydrolase family protein [Candidatus Acidoferrum sp.]|nr:amidohydrolase family protein [Candidatus Acidoferrum sp.]